MGTNNVKGKILLVFDNPSEIAKNYSEDFYYAVIADNISDLSGEGHLVMVFTDKEEYESGKGTLSYCNAIMIENIFEYTASII